LTNVNKEVNMRFIQLAKGLWEVLAYLDHRGRCQVLDHLASLGANFQGARDKMVRLLCSQIPLQGPPMQNARICKCLGGSIYELRGQHRGQKLRVVFFYDDNRKVICTNAFSKAETTPQNELRVARELREQYLRVKFRKELQILTRREHDV
jgi:phage-related protein